MSLTTAALRELVRCGLTPDQILAVAEAQEEDKPRSSGAERQARYRARQAESVTCDVTRDVTPSDAPPSLSPSPQTPQPHTHPRVDIYPAREVTDFEDFWDAYPAKIAKKAARKAWDAAKDRPDLPNLLAALSRYRETKPPDRDWCHPATWLNQGRWADEAPAPPQPRRAESRNERPDHHTIRAEGRSAWAEILAEHDSAAAGGSPPLRLAS